MTIKHVSQNTPKKLDPVPPNSNISSHFTYFKSCLLAMIAYSSFHDNPDKAYHDFMIT